LTVKGQYRDNIVAYARCHLRNWVLVTAPLHTASITTEPLSKFDWQETTIILPAEAPLEWYNVLTGKTFVFSEEIDVNDLFKNFR
jgi:(1->4)-alpha-D-glucan 1-alpha-D-glucosylmutase